MATLISVDEFRERFDIDTEIQDRRLEPHIGSASRRLRKWVGATVYDAAAEDSTPGEDDDDDTVNDLKNAEAHLAMHFAILGLNSPLSTKGVVATSTSDEGRDLRKYLTPDETQKLSVQVLELAREIAGEYIAADENIGVAFIETDIDTDLPWLISP